MRLCLVVRRQLSLVISSHTTIQLWDASLVSLTTTKLQLSVLSPSNHCHDIFFKFSSEYSSFKICISPCITIDCICISFQCWCLVISLLPVIILLLCARVLLLIWLRGYYYVGMPFNACNILVVLSCCSVFSFYFVCFQLLVFFFLLNSSCLASEKEREKLAIMLRIVNVCYLLKISQFMSAWFALSYMWAE